MAKGVFMKNFVKWFRFIAFAAAISFSLVSCDLNNNDYEKLNGDWDRVGQYVVTFNDGKGLFKELYGGIWLEGKNAGQIKTGEQCYRNLIKSGDNEWTGEIRIYNTYSPYETLRWEDCTITLNANGQTIQIAPNAGTFSTFNCTRR
jgi:uncharacterized protein (DUF2147 family)